MPAHDTYPRLTPYERLLPDAEFPARRFPSIRDEAARRGIGLEDPAAFALLETASEALDEIVDGQADPEVLGRHALLLFHAYHHHAAGTPVLLLGGAVVRHLVEQEPEGPTGPEAMAPSTYLQFPQHLVWSRAGVDAPPSSLDGVYRVVTADARVHLLAVGGLLGDRPGFTVVPVPGAPLDHEDAWVSATMRSEGDDFSTRIPGAELDRLYEVETAGELLKLVARAVRLVGARPARVSRIPTVAPEDGVNPPRSALPAQRLDLLVGGPHEPQP